MDLENRSKIRMRKSYETKNNTLCKNCKLEMKLKLNLKNGLKNENQTFSKNWTLTKKKCSK